MNQNTSSVVIARYNRGWAMYDKDDERIKHEKVIYGTFKVNDNFDADSNIQDWGIFTTLSGMRYKINRSWEVTGAILGQN